MSILIQITITDDESGEVSKTFVQSYDSRWSWDTARVIRELLGRVFKIVYGPDNDDW